MAAWEYIGWRNDYRGHYLYWTNAGKGGNHVAWAPYDRFDNVDRDLTDIPPAFATVEYDALEEYDGDIIALTDDWGIVRESLY